MNILLIEDNQKIAELVKKGFREQSHNLDIVYDGIHGLRQALDDEYDVVILDLIIPGLDGLEVCRRIRRFKNDLPILILTALGTTLDKVKGFESGADDYLTKPFHFDELLARVQALWRRSQRITPELIYKVANLEVDAYKKTVHRAGKEISLTAREFAMLELLIMNKNRVLSRMSISDAIWGIHQQKNTNIIDVYINYLRAKIDKGFSPQLIHTVIGMGYVLRDE
ncbi:response regulator [Dinghuibacter silviterrae]|uniref:DNA-binding response OmpR family regulator n=1 Tax=Dinghuibacter silviterrae TaxID=1539049 RepID=A0A4R8DU74_9BACT|nr:response regulator transcription factor [Dinghuibacter silviterrae]TDX00967.1 DNA-binding response OmpR family regulator [Dinghuibacter silviterrae]